MEKCIAIPNYILIKIIFETLCCLCSKKYRHKLNRSGSMYNVPEFVVEGCNLEISGRDKMTAHELNQLALHTVEKYITSTDEEIKDSHTPDLPFDSYQRIPDCIFGRFKELVR